MIKLEEMVTFMSDVWTKLGNVMHDLAFLVQFMAGLT
jgi:hypothetical protein